MQPPLQISSIFFLSMLLRNSFIADPFHIDSKLSLPASPTGLRQWQWGNTLPPLKMKSLFHGAVQKAGALVSRIREPGSCSAV